MAHPGFGHLWQQQELSDIEIVIGIEIKDATPASESSWSHVVNKKARYIVLQRLPGHKSIISLSPYCKAQVLRWQDTTISSSTSTHAYATSTDKQQVRLTLLDASYEAAAVALLQVLYLVKPVSHVLADLTQEQQVQAAVLADMWQVPAAGVAVSTVLKEAASSAEGLSEAVLEQMLAMQAVPDCLLELFEHALLSRLGDLEATWADRRLRKRLETLPLFAMEVLLSSDKLKITSEDTMLYTAQAYVNALPEEQKQKAQDRLAPLVRCPHLSQLWLSAAGLSADAPKLLLSGLRPQVQQLLLAQQLGCNLTTNELKSDITNVPANWLLPPRANKVAGSVQVIWEVDVATIKTAVTDSASSRVEKSIKSPATAPLLGVAWHITLQAHWDADEQGTNIGVYATPKNLPANTYYKCRFTLKEEGTNRLFAITRMSTHRFRAADGGRGWRDFFNVGPMSGGFDEVAWAAKGLPTSGQLALKLTVSIV